MLRLPTPNSARMSTTLTVGNLRFEIRLFNFATAILPLGFKFFQTFKDGVAVPSITLAPIFLLYELPIPLHDSKA